MRAYLELRIACFLYIAVHVDLIVEGLVHLDDERLESCVLIALKLLEECLCPRLFHRLILNSES